MSLYATHSSTACLLELSGCPNFRPRWRYYSWQLSLGGAALTVFSMFFLVRYGKELEAKRFEGRAADFLWCMSATGLLMLGHDHRGTLFWCVSLRALSVVCGSAILSGEEE